MKRSTSTIAIAALLLASCGGGGGEQCRAGAGAARSGPAAAVPGSGGRRPDLRRGAADRRPGRRRGAGAGPSRHHRGGRPGRQRARRLPHDRRQRRPRRPELAERGQPRPPGLLGPQRRGRGRDRQGDHRRLSVVERQRLLDQDREPDRAGAFPALGRGPGPGERPPVRRPVQPVALLRSVDAVRRASPCRRVDRPEALAARPFRRSGRFPALQERRRGRRRRLHGRRHLRLRPGDPGRRQRCRGSDRARRHPGLRRRRPTSGRPVTVDGTACASATPASPICAPAAPRRLRIPARPAR